MPNELYQEHEKIKSIIKSKGLNIDIFMEHYEGDVKSVFRLYITSKSLGGLCIINSGLGWLPCFPEKENYPIKGRWYAPFRNPCKNWINAMLAKLDPEEYLKKMLSVSETDIRIAATRNESNINSFRRMAAIGIFKNLLESEN